MIGRTQIGWLLSTNVSPDQDGVWLLVDIDTSRLDTRPTRLNVSLPRGLVAQMDRYAKAHGMTRSGLIRTAVSKVLEERS